MATLRCVLDQSSPAWPRLASPSNFDSPGTTEGNNVPKQSPVSPPTDPLAVFILARPGMAETLLTLHRDDGTGHCSVCSSGGQSGRFTWPCRTSSAATAAAEYLSQVAPRQDGSYT
jgi:hypothetical protein